jgi:hypothetical protein
MSKWWLTAKGTVSKYTLSALCKVHQYSVRAHPLVDVGWVMDDWSWGYDPYVWDSCRSELILHISLSGLLYFLLQLLDLSFHVHLVLLGKGMFRYQQFERGFREDPGFWCSFSVMVAKEKTFTDKEVLLCMPPYNQIYVITYWSRIQAWGSTALVEFHSFCPIGVLELSQC